MDGKACAGSNSAKRARDDSDGSGESPRAKRLYAADRILLDMLEDVDSGDRGPADLAPGDLATVMKSFEEEIAALSPCPPLQHPAGDGAAQISASTPDADDPGQSDLGYLLEASDDDLGLPPTLPPSSDEGEVVHGGLGEDGNRGFEALGQLWGFDDEAPICYDELGFGGFAQEDGVAGGDDGVALYGDLFGYADVASSGPSEFSDFSWRPESLPAV